MAHRARTSQRVEFEARLASVLGRRYRDLPRLLRDISQVVPVGAIECDGQRIAITRSEDGYEARLLKSGTPKRVDHARGYFLSRLILLRLQQLKPALRLAKRQRKSMTAAFAALSGEHSVVSRLERAGLHRRVWEALDDTGVKNAWLLVAAELARFEWEQDEERDVTAPLPSAKTIAAAKSLRGEYDRVFRSHK